MAKSKDIIKVILIIFWCILMIIMIYGMIYTSWHEDKLKNNFCKDNKYDLVAPNNINEIGTFRCIKRIYNNDGSYELTTSGMFLRTDIKESVE